MISIFVFKLTKISKKSKNKKIRKMKITIILILVSQIWSFPLNETLNNSYSDNFQRLNEDMLFLHRNISKLRDNLIEEINKIVSIKFNEIMIILSNFINKAINLQQEILLIQKNNLPNLKPVSSEAQKAAEDINTKKRVQNEIKNIQIKMIQMNEQYNYDIKNIKNEMVLMKNKITNSDVLDKLEQTLKIKIDKVNLRYHDMMRNFHNQIKNLKNGIIPE